MLSAVAKVDRITYPRQHNCNFWQLPQTADEITWWNQLVLNAKEGRSRVKRKSSHEDRRSDRSIPDPDHQKFFFFFSWIIYFMSNLRQFQFWILDTTLLPKILVLDKCSSQTGSCRLIGLNNFAALLRFCSIEKVYQSLLLLFRI